MRGHRLTFLEVVVVIAVVTVVLVVVLQIGGGNRRRSATVKDSAQIKQIQQAWLGKANETRGLQIPLPSTQDESRNQHAAFHSMMVAQNLFNTDVLCSPNEPNSHVVVCKNYNYNAYQPAQGKFWDAVNFTCDLNTKCNTSYALMPLDPTTRRRMHFFATLDSTNPQLGTRGRKGGAGSGWQGNLCFADNHMEFVETPFLASTAGPPDNLFKNDTNALPFTDPLRNSDVFLVIQKDAAPTGTFITEESSEITWD